MASTCLRRRIAVIGTVAGGLGDVTFIANILHLLSSGSASVVDIVLCQQAGGDADAAVRALVEQFSEVGTVKPFLGVVCCTHRLPSGACGTTFVHLNDGVTSLRPGPPLAVRPDRFLQGPLVLFESGESAAAALLVGVTEAVSLPRAEPPLLLTIREFGQGGFCARRRDGAGALDGDVSAGFAPGEVGIFRLQSPPPLRPEPLRPPYIVGYFRAGQHHTHFGRLAASVLLADAAAPSESAEERIAVVFGPWAAGDAGAELPRLARFVDAVALHPGVARAALVQPPPAPSSERVTPWLSCISGAAGSWAEVASVEVQLAPLLRSSDGQGRSPAHREMRLVLVSLPALALSVARFRALLAGAEAAVVTGDASLNEAVCFGVPLWYSSEPHKAGTLAALRRLASQGTQAGAVIAAWWSYIDGPRGRGGGEVGDAATALWEEFRAAAAALARETRPPRVDLRLAFESLWTAAAMAPASECGLRFIDDALMAWLS